MATKNPAKGPSLSVMFSAVCWVWLAWFLINQERRQPAPSGPRVIRVSAGPGGSVTVGSPPPAERITRMEGRVRTTVVKNRKQVGWPLDDKHTLTAELRVEEPPPEDDLRATAQALFEPGHNQLTVFLHLPGQDKGGAYAAVEFDRAGNITRFNRYESALLGTKWDTSGIDWSKRKRESKSSDTTLLEAGIFSAEELRVGMSLELPCETPYLKSLESRPGASVEEVLAEIQKMPKLPAGERIKILELHNRNGNVDFFRFKRGWINCVAMMRKGCCPKLL